MTKAFLILTATIILILGFATLAFAWGPGVHMAISNAVLARPWLIPAATAQILAAHSQLFMYGSLSADIFIGKGSKAKKSHSHNWKTGFILLEKAKDESLLAYSLGYLSHLAADIVAHNYYVPNLLTQAPSGGKFNHVFIEMLADNQVSWSARQARTLFQLSTGDADKTLRASMDSHKLSFLLKKGVFHRTIGLLEYRPLHASLNFSRKVIPLYQLEYLQNMLDLSFRSVVDLLKNPYKAKALNYDPIGSQHLITAKNENKFRSSLRRRKQDFNVRFDVDSGLFSLPLVEDHLDLLKANQNSLLLKTKM